MALAIRSITSIRSFVVDERLKLRIRQASPPKDMHPMDGGSIRLGVDCRAIGQRMEEPPKPPVKGSSRATRHMAPAENRVSLPSPDVAPHASGNKQTMHMGLPGLALGVPELPVEAAPLRSDAGSGGAVSRPW